MMKAAVLPAIGAREEGGRWAAAGEMEGKGERKREGGEITTYTTLLAAHSQA